jgi:hypothetical protein
VNIEKFTGGRLKSVGKSRRENVKINRRQLQKKDGVVVANKHLAMQTKAILV